MQLRDLMSPFEVMSRGARRKIARSTWAARKERLERMKRLAMQQAASSGCSLPYILDLAKQYSEAQEV